MTPQTSVVEPTVYNRDYVDEVTDDEVDSDQSSIYSETEAMFKKMAVVDLADLHVLFRCESFDLSFTSDASKQISNIQNESALLNDESDVISSSTQ